MYMYTLYMYNSRAGSAVGSFSLSLSLSARVIQSPYRLPLLSFATANFVELCNVTRRSCCGLLLLLLLLLLLRNRNAQLTLTLTVGGCSNCALSFFDVQRPCAFSLRAFEIVWKVNKWWDESSTRARGIHRRVYIDSTLESQSIQRPRARLQGFRRQARRFCTDCPCQSSAF